MNAIDVRPHCSLTIEWTFYVVGLEGNHFANSHDQIDESLASLKARSITVFPVGVGQEHFARDIQIARVETPRSTLKGTSLAVDVVISQTGYAGTTVPLHVEDEGKIVSSQDVTLPADGQSTTVRVNFTTTDGGPTAPSSWYSTPF